MRNGLSKTLTPQSLFRGTYTGTVQPQAVFPPSVAVREESPTYIHTQSTASILWTIPHNLGYQPHVSLTTLGGVEFDAEVRHTSNNVTEVHHKVAIAGQARLS